MNELNEVSIHPLVSNTVKNQLARAFCYLILQSKAVGVTLFDIVLSHEGKLQLVVNAKSSRFLDFLKDKEISDKIFDFFGKDFKIDEKGYIKKEFEDSDHLKEFLIKCKIFAQIDVDKLYQELYQESDELYQELRKAFEAFRSDDAAFNNDQGDGLLKKKFQIEFLKINKDLVENVKNAISAFIANPQNQACIIKLETLLIEMSVKIHKDLEGEQSFTAGDFVPIANVILELMSDMTGSLEFRHAECIELLINNWGEDRMTYWFPMSMMNILLGQIYNRLPLLTAEEDEAYRELKESLLEIKQHGERFTLFQEVKSYFDNRFFSDLEKTKNLIANLEKANIIVPECLYNNKILYANPYVLTLDKLENVSNKFIGKLKNKKWIFEADNNGGIPFSLDNTHRDYTIKFHEKIDEDKQKILREQYAKSHSQQAVRLLHEMLKCNFKPNYMLSLEQGSHLVDVEMTDTSPYCVITYPILFIIKLNHDVQGKCVFSIPGRVQAIFERTNWGLRLQAIGTSNRVLLKLVTESLEECNEVVLEKMVAQAKEEESHELLNKWYMEQSKIFYAKEFSLKYQDIFDCEAFKKKFEEEASEFLGFSKKTETLWSAFGQVVGKVKLDVEKLFMEDKKNVETIFSEKQEEEHNEEYKFIRDLYSAISGNKNNVNFKNIKIPQPFPRFNLDYNDDSLCITISREAKEFVAVFNQHNAKLNVKDNYGNIYAVFKSPVELKEFLKACKVSDSDIDKMTQNLYETLHKEKYKYSLALDELEKSSNAEIILLKNIGWTYASINRDGGIFSQDINRDMQVNGRELNPSKNSELISEKINAHAEKFPLIKQYQFVHLQMPAYLTRSILTTNVSIGEFIVLESYNSNNVELVQDSACLILNNNSFIISRSNFRKLDNLNKLLFFIPGHVQTVFEMVGKHRLQVISSKELIPEDGIIENNRSCLYLYSDQDTLTYAVYDAKTSKAKRIIIGDNELGKDNAGRIRRILQESADSLDFETMGQITVLLPFLEFAAEAGYPILGLKLKTIKVSNRALHDLVTGNFERCDENMLAEMVRRAKQEEPKESLWEWYKVQAKKFEEKGFPEKYSLAMFQQEVRQFLTDNYKNPDEKYEQFWEEVARLLDSGKYILDMPSPKSTLSLSSSSSFRRPLPQIPPMKKQEGEKKEEAEIDLIFPTAYKTTGSNATLITTVCSHQSNHPLHSSPDINNSNSNPKTNQQEDNQEDNKSECRIS